MLRRSFNLLCCGTLVGAALDCSAAETGFPTRSVRMLVGTSAAGPTDTVARTVSARLDQILGQSFVVENRDGANGLIAGTALVRSQPDGYTLQLGSTSTSVLSLIVTRTAAFRHSDLAPVAMVGTTPMVLYVNPQVPARNGTELVAMLKQSPGKYSYASAGVGATSNVTGELFKIRTGVDMVHVPYRGGAQLDQSVMAGDTQIGFNTLGGVIGLHRAGKVRILMVLSDRRSELAPEIPTSAEAGCPGLISMFNLYVVAPAKTPASVVNVLNAAAARMLADAEFRKQLTTLLIDVPAPLDPAQVQAAFNAEVEQWRSVVSTAHITVD
ncbi:tripartite tricarboxylate transporter substrate binding protein [soil metagenome]